MYISAIIPAYNEECTISNVINTLKDIECIDEIIAISDGSKDKTAAIAKNCGIKVIELYQNMGKGAAIKAGLENCRGDIVLFLDADLIGLNKTHVHDLLCPVLNGEADMTVGIFSKGRFSTDLAQRISPCLSGQRAVRKSILDSISCLETTGYGIEIALTKYAERENIRAKEVVLKDITHVMKEEKLGFIRGVGERMKMYWQIYKGLRFAKR